MISASWRANGQRPLLVAVTAVALLAAPVQPAPAQQPPTRADSVPLPLRADYRDLNELLQKLPTIAPPAFDEARALSMGSLPLSCLDRLQSRPGRGGGRGVIADTTAARGANAGPTSSATPDSTGRATGAAARGGGANNGAGYFWLPTYSLLSDHDRLRAFWGCTDWHSAVGSIWVTVRLLKDFPNSPLKDLAREKLNAHLGKSNLDGEIAFFHATAEAINPIPSSNQTGLFERPYGFAWLLKLQTELRSWPDSQAKRWAANVSPLATWMADSLAAYLAKLPEPVRAGTQANTAMSLTLALDYASAVGNTALRASLIKTARHFYLNDKGCSTQTEPVLSGAAGRGGRGGGRGRGAGRGGGDSTARDTTALNDLTASGRGASGAATPPAGGGAEILSPCLTEAALMGLVLEPRAFVSWLDAFLPALQSGKFAPLTEPIRIATVDVASAGRGQARGAARTTNAGSPDSARTAQVAAATAAAAEHARVSGLSFARAQAMERIAHALPSADPRVAVWHRLSAIQAARGFELLRDDSAGISWVPAYVLLYLTARS